MRRYYDQEFKTSELIFTRRQSIIIGIFFFLSMLIQGPLTAAETLSVTGVRNRVTTKTSGPTTLQDTLISCDPLGTCFLQTLTPLMTASLSEALPTKLLEKNINVSSYALQAYAAKKATRTAEQDTLEVIRVLQDLSRTNERIFCKLKMLFTDSPGFNILLTTQKDPFISKPPPTEMAVFKRSHNTLVIFINKIFHPEFSGFVLHESHHAFVYYENAQKKFRFFESDHKEWRANSLPCVPNDIYTNCIEINDIMNAGFQRATTIISLIEQPEASLNTEQAVFLKHYKKLIKNYRPLAIDTPMDETTINLLKKQKLLDDHLKILDPTGYLVHPYNKEQYAYIHRIKKQDGQYSGEVKTCLEPNNPKAPVWDMLYLFDGYEKSGKDDLTIIKEKDTIIHQLFSRYPELIDFLFPRLESFHFKRAGQKIQQCMMSLR